MRRTLKGFGVGMLTLSLALAADFGGRELQAQTTGTQQGSGASNRTAAAPAATPKTASKSATTASSRHWYNLPRRRSTATSSVTKPAG